MMVGALGGGHLMKKGRRRALLIACAIGIFGISITARLDFITILFGRLIFGTSTGIMATTIPRFIEETTPSSYFDRVASIWKISMALGSLNAYCLGYILPYNQDVQALKETDRWLIIYFWFPLILYVCMILGLVFVVRYDAIKFLINSGSTIDAKLAIMQVYKYQDPSDVLKSLSKSLNT